jgi:UrcA family protein
METTQVTKIILTTVIAAVLAAGAGSAMASGIGDSNTVSTVVHYADLNLANPADAQVMLTRIKAAARNVCEPRPTTILEYDEWRSCVAQATKGGVSRLSAPMVTAAYTGKQANPVHLAENSPR